jgi:STE24 endopeptidase
MAAAVALALCLGGVASAKRQSKSLAPTQSVQAGATTPGAPAQSATGAEQSSQEVTAYTLPPDRYKKARDLGRIEFRLQLVDIFYGLLVLWLILLWKIAPKYRDWAEKASSRRVLQALVFGPLIIFTMDVFSLPTEIYGEWVSRSYGLSVQRWGSWTWDWAKGEAVSIIGGTIVVMILYAVILEPLVIDPLFHKFEPLAAKDPGLTAALEQMVQRAGKDIPPQRMFWMGAAEKSTELDAYVTGVGKSKRIVVWDTTIAKMTQPEIVFATGHEMGHYVLDHIPKGIAFYAALLLVAFYLGFKGIGWMLGRWGAKWAIRGVDDWASLPALLLLLSVFSIVVHPAGNAFSRHIEHQADQYGLEVTHGLTPDSGQVAARAFEVLGNVDLADPAPNPVDVFLFYTHPTIAQRIRFALTYDPWARGGHGEFVR